MKMTADTNVLVRALIGDDERQSKIAQMELKKAELVALALPALCELVWVLSQGYKIPSSEIAKAIRRLKHACRQRTCRARTNWGATGQPCLRGIS
jgi:predicted nucleic-acid-binding protein